MSQERKSWVLQQKLWTALDTEPDPVVAMTALNMVVAIHLVRFAVDDILLDEAIDVFVSNLRTGIPMIVGTHAGTATRQ